MFKMQRGCEKPLKSSPSFETASHLKVCEPVKLNRFQTEIQIFALDKKPKQYSRITLGLKLETHKSFNTQMFIQPN